MPKITNRIRQRQFYTNLDLLNGGLSQLIGVIRQNNVKLTINSAPSPKELTFFKAGLYTARSLYHEALECKC